MGAQVEAGQTAASLMNVCRLEYVLWSCWVRNWHQLHQPQFKERLAAALLFQRDLRPALVVQLL
jgi:hypothetical protein